MSHQAPPASRDFSAPLNAETHRRTIIAHARREGDAYRAKKPGRLPHRKRKRLDEVLENYSGMIKGKAWEFARRHSGRVGAGFWDDREDFEQVGRIGAWRAFEEKAAWPSYRPTAPPAYFRAAIENGMKDELRHRERRNSEVYKYDKARFPTRTKRFRYGGEWKARASHHGEGLERVEYTFLPPLSIDAEDKCGRPRGELVGAVAPDGQGRTWGLLPTSGRGEKI